MRAPQTAFSLSVALASSRLIPVLSGDCVVLGQGDLLGYSQGKTCELGLAQRTISKIRGGDRSHL